MRMNIELSELSGMRTELFDVNQQELRAVEGGFGGGWNVGWSWGGGDSGKYDGMTYVDGMCYVDGRYY